MSFLETNRPWIAVIYKVLQSAAALLLKLFKNKRYNYIDLRQFIFPDRASRYNFW